MVLIPLLAAPSLMLATTAVERRFGPAVAGAMASMPVALSIIVLAVGVELGPDAGATLAASAAAHVVAQVAFALAFATLVERHGGARGLLAGVLAFATVSALVELIPTPLAIALALPTLASIRGSDPSTRISRKSPCSERNRIVKGSDPSTIAVGAGAALGMVSVALATAELAGPAAAGAIGAFPALSTAFALVLVRTRGREAAARALRGLVSGLRAYLVFCLTAAVAAPALGIVAGVPLALALCLLTYAALLRPTTR
jgi:hypothetical protein